MPVMPQPPQMEPVEQRLCYLAAGMDDLIEMAVASIDRVLGDGYAEQNPRLIGDVLKANATHALSKGLDVRLEWIGTTLAAGADAIDNLNGGLTQIRDALV